MLMTKISLTLKDEIGEPRGKEGCWSIHSRVSYRVPGVTSRCPWCNSFKIPQCSQGIYYLSHNVHGIYLNCRSLNMLGWDIPLILVLSVFKCFTLFLFYLFTYLFIYFGFRQLWQQRGPGNWLDKRVFWNLHHFLESLQIVQLLILKKLVWQLPFINYTKKLDESECRRDQESIFTFKSTIQICSIDPPLSKIILVYQIQI